MDDVNTQNSDLVRLVMHPDEATWIGRDGDILRASGPRVSDVLIVRHPEAPRGVALILEPDEDLEERLGVR